MSLDCAFFDPIHPKSRVMPKEPFKTDTVRQRAKRIQGRPSGLSDGTAGGAPRRGGAPPAGPAEARGSTKDTKEVGAEEGA